MLVRVDKDTVYKREPNVRVTTGLGRGAPTSHRRSETNESILPKLRPFGVGCGEKTGPLVS